VSRDDAPTRGRTLHAPAALPEPATSNRMRPPTLAGKIGFTLLAVYLLAVAFRIGGCYVPDARIRDELPDRGPRLGEEFPAFTLGDLAGGTVGRNPVPGSPAVLLFLPSLDWSPPSKARVIDFTQALGNQPTDAVTVVFTEAQATARALRFVRDRKLPFRFVVDTEGLVERLGFTTPAPDGTTAALSATFVLDAAGVVRLRDVRQRTRTWLAPEVVQQTLAALRHAPPP